MVSRYTPFLAKAGASIGQGIEKRAILEQKELQNRLAGSAYMGDPQAMEGLMQVNPQLGMQMQQQAQKRKAEEEQAAIAKQTRMRKLFSENKEIIDRVIEDVAAFDNYDQAKAYYDRKREENRPIFGDALDNVELTQEMYEQAKQVHRKQADGIDEVQSSKILPGGLVQLVMKSGAIKTVEPEKENIAKIKEAEERGAELQGLRAGERGAASSAIKESVNAFKKMVGIRKTISLYEEGIRLLSEEGANTGPIYKMAPSFKAASIELENVQANLGLNVIQNTTFGSLSKEELLFALDTTMPRAMTPEKLIDWMVRKRDSQMKLSKYLEKAAIFLGTPPNTIADFIRQQKTKQFAGAKESEPKKPEGVIRFDKKGKRIE